MNSHPLVSVSIPTYNCEDFIRECIDSVILQNYPNTEIIISDDASTDNTAQILKEYQQKYPNLIKLNINEKNMGITKNGNLIFSLCSGKYVVMFAGDDVMLPGKISTQVKYMESNDECSISYHNVEVFCSDDSFIKKPYLHQHSIKPKNGDYKIALEYGPFPFFISSSCVVRHDKIPAYGYDESIKMASDALLWIEILENGGEIHYIDKTLCRYRMHKHNTSRLRYSELTLDFLIIQSKLLIKYPEYSSNILANYANNLFSIAKHNPKSIYYLKASFRIKKSVSVFIFIILYYLTFGKISANSTCTHQINRYYFKSKVYCRKIVHKLSSRILKHDSA